MRKIAIIAFVSLDGVAQGPVQIDEDTSGGFTQSGWTADHIEEAMALVNVNLMEAPVSFLFGRKTYEMFSSHWPNSKTSHGDLLNQSQKYVVSSSLTHASWEHTEIISENPVEALQRLKEEDGPRLQVHGSTALIQTLLAHDLVDELRLLTFPVLLGSGQRLFGSGTVPASLTLTKFEVSDSGVVMGVYNRN